MLTLFSSSKTLSSVSSFPSSYTPSSPKPIFSKSTMEEKLQKAEAIITKWDLNSSSFTKVTFLFHHNRKEAKEFLKSVKDLHQVMHFLVSEKSPSGNLVLPQTIMQIAMKRLEHEFYQILSKNCDQLDPESFSGQSSDGSSNLDAEEEASEDEDELKRAGETITEVERLSQLAMSDLRAIADCMISSGYGKECIKIYKLMRKSIVDEGLYQLGIEQFKASRIQKMDWEALEHMIKNWLSAVKIAVKTLFSGEKVLCDHVFSVSNTIRESCFCHITEGAMNLFRFPELIVKSKNSQERIFRLMELYEALTDLLPEIEVIFNSGSTSVIKLQALSSEHKLGDSIRTILSDFESRIQKDSSKAPVVRGEIHPFTESAMSFICSLGDYSGILSEIVAEYPPRNSTNTDSSLGSPTTNLSSRSAASVHLAWLILVLLCKLDCKAEPYKKDVSLLYLFLANNLNFIIGKVRTSHLKELLGDDWMCRHTKKLKQYALNYETMAWTKVFSSLPEKNSSAIPLEVAKECFRRFNAAFEEAYMKQTSWIVPDRKLRDELKVSIAKKLVPAHTEFFDTYCAMLSGDRNAEVLMRFGPDDLGNYLSDLFHGTPIFVNSSSSSSCSSQGCIPR